MKVRGQQFSVSPRVIRSPSSAPAVLSSLQIDFSDTYTSVFDFHPHSRWILRLSTHIYTLSNNSVYIYTFARSQHFWQYVQNHT